MTSISPPHTEPAQVEDGRRPLHTVIKNLDQAGKKKKKKSPAQAINPKSARQTFITPPRH